MDKRRTYTVIGKNIVKKIANKTILDDVNITVEKKSIYALLGENDEGKSVLLKYLADGLKSGSGNVQITTYFDDKDPDDEDPDDPLIGTMTVAERPSVGFMPQSFHVPTPITTYELLRSVGAVNGLSENQIIVRYQAMAEMIGLPESDHLVNRLGYIQKKTLFLVLAVIHEPDIIILDDITSGIDTKTLKKIWTLLLHINKSRECTIIVSASDNFCFMESIVTHIGILMNGKIVEEETIEHLMEKYEASNIEDLFIEIINTKDDQRDPSAKIGKSRTIKSPITLEDTSPPLNSIFTTQIDAAKRLINTCTILHALVLKNILMLVGINWTSLAELTGALMLPLVVYAAFVRYPQRAATAAVHNHETCEGGSIAEAGGGGTPMSCVFIRLYLGQSFHLMNIPSENHTALRIDDFECLLSFEHNYTEALRRRIERNITRKVDFKNSLVVITMKITDGRKAAHVKDQLLRRYSEFLSDYAYKLTNYVFDINYNSIQYNYMLVYEDDDGYHIYSRFVNSGLIVFLAFFINTSISIWLRKQVTDNDNYYSEWMLYLSHLVVHIIMAVFGNILMVTQLFELYNSGTHYGYVFLCLMLNSICGIHLGYALCLFIKNYYSIALIIHLKLTICAYASGLWWTANEFFSWWHAIINFTPLSSSISFVRNVIDKRYFDINSLFISFFWAIISIIITVIGINNYQKLKNVH